MYSRRTIAKGAAWAVPVIAAATAAPMAVASPVCNIIPAGGPSAWVRRYLNNGGFNCTKPSTGTTDWVGTTWYSVADHFSQACGAFSAIYTVTAPITVQAGVCYEISIPVAWNYFDNRTAANPLGSPQRFQLTIGTPTSGLTNPATVNTPILTLQTRAQTRPNDVPANAGFQPAGTTGFQSNIVYHDHSVTYCATANATLEIAMTFTVFSDATGNDDFYVQVPTVTTCA